MKIKKDLKPKFQVLFGGLEEDRTLDLTDANRTLSQLSYAPKGYRALQHMYYTIISMRVKIVFPPFLKRSAFST